MYVCYIDEAGCTGGMTGPDSAVQPVFALNGLIVPAGRIHSLTRAWIQLKQAYFPKRLPSGSSIHDWMGIEIKGSDIRRMARGDGRNERRFAHHVIGSSLDLLERHGAQVVGRVWVKPIPGTFDGTAVYTSSVQFVCRSFETFLEQNDDVGIVIADSRNKPKNTNVAHSIFTQRYSAAGDPYGRIVEMPTFGHSDNHAGLQLADIICSGLLFPIAAQRCAAHILTDHTHVSAHYERLPDRFGERLQAMQYRYRDAHNYWHGGVALTDSVSHQPSTVLFAKTH